MTIYVFCQEGGATHWISQYHKGIKNEAKRKGHEIITIECSLDASSLPSELSGTSAAIVLSGTYEWTCGICSLLRCLNVKPIVVGYDQSDDIDATGYVLMDYKKAIYDLLDYFASCNRTRVALFAVSLESPADKLKTDAFLSYKGERGEQFNQKDIFYFRGMTKSTCESFISVCSDYDAIIGTNDVSTAILLQTLKTHGINVPKDLFVASFGDTTLSKSTTNELTLALLDCYSVGIQAAKMCVALTKATNISNSVIRLRCDIDVKCSTDNVARNKSRTPVASESTQTPASSFLADPHVNEIVVAERLLEKCDSLDLEIMRSLLKKEKYIDIADKLHVSENTVKYRIKRLLNFAHLDSRGKLTELMKSYLS